MGYSDKFMTSLKDYSNFQQVGKRVLIEVVCIEGIHYAVYRTWVGGKQLIIMVVTLETAHLAGRVF